MHLTLPHFSALNLSLTRRTASPSDLRPCQRAYLGRSNARRLFKKSQLMNKPSHEEPIFALHEEVTTEGIPAALETLVAKYTVQCYATHAEDEQKRRDGEALEKEKLILLNHINSSRLVEGTHALRIKPSLSKLAQDYATMLYNEEHSSITPTPAAPSSVVVVMAPSGARVARLVSQPRIGALACGEMWYGGKYKRHLYNLSAEDVATHPEHCPCHLRMVFETMVDTGWTALGIGRAEDGRWVVELGQEDVGREVCD